MEKSIVSKHYTVLRLLLKTIRQEKKLSQRDVASRIEETQAFVSRVERGERRIDVIELRQFCKALDVNYFDFLQKLETEIQKQERSS